MRRDGEEGVLRKVEKMQVTGKTEGTVGTVSTERHEKEGTKRGAGNGSEKLIKGPPIVGKEKDYKRK